MPKIPKKPKSSSKGSDSKKRKKAKLSSGATEEQLIKDLAKKFCKPLPNEELTELRESLQNEFDLEDIMELDAEELWEAVENSDNHLVIEKASDLHKKGVSVVWKMFNFITGSEENFLAYIPQVLARAGIKKITAKFDPLNATYRSVIKTDDRRVASRGAQAIRWAEHEKQTPDSLLDFPGGVEEWSRKWQTLCREQKAAAGGKVKPKTTTAAVKLVELRSKLKDGRRVLLMVKMEGSTLVSQGFQILPKGKGQYWPLIKAAIGKAISAKPKAAKT
jgi:hypothetical protein